MKKRRIQAFTLFELLIVMTIIAILMSMSAPMLSSFQDFIGKGGAINQLLGTFEQARIAALSSGTTTYVGFVTDDPPPGKSSWEYRTYVVFRDKTDYDKTEKIWTDSTDTNRTYVQLSKWRQLPQNVYFYNTGPGLTGDGTTNNIISLDSHPFDSVSFNDMNLSIIAFNNHGGVSIPSQEGNLRLLLRFTDEEASWKFNLEEITFRKFTGRAERNIQIVDGGDSASRGNKDTP